MQIVDTFRSINMEIVYSLLIALALTMLVVLPALGVAGVASRRVIVVSVLVSYIAISILSYWYGMGSAFLALL
jgi:hypothetical protein